MKIAKIHARQILDSRGNPTVEADVTLENGMMGRAAVPSGASTGSNEALELRDFEKAFDGKGVLKAIKNVNEIIAPDIVGMEVTDQQGIDKKLLELDGTENKSKLGANAILAVSVACAKAAAISQNLPLHTYLHQTFAITEKETLPLPMMNIINGGAHANFSTDIQEFMIMCKGAQTFSEALQMGAEVFQSLGKLLKNEGFATTVGDEGGYAPKFRGNAEALEFISKAVEAAGYHLGNDIVLALDVAASEFFEDGKYNLNAEKKSLTSTEIIDFLVDLTEKYPIVSIEDGLSEDDWEGWVTLNHRLGQKIQLVGDDLLVTNTQFLKKAIDQKACNAILIKLNQIGSLTETVNAVKMAKEAGFGTIISHRSGETEDTSIAHLAVGLAAGQIKTGSLSRTDRVAKYNELLRIEEEMVDKAIFAGKSVIKK